MQLQGFLSFANISQLFDMVSAALLLSDPDPTRQDGGAQRRMSLAELAADSSRPRRSSTLQESLGYLQLDSTFTADSINALHYALLERRNSQVSVSLRHSLYFSSLLFSLLPFPSSQIVNEKDEESGTLSQRGGSLSYETLSRNRGSPFSSQASLSVNEENLYDDFDELDPSDIITHSYQNRQEGRALQRGGGEGGGGEGTQWRGKEEPAAIVLHCNLLLGLDASAIDVIEQIALLCRQRCCALIFASLRRSHLKLLQKAQLLSPGKGEDERGRVAVEGVVCAPSLNDALLWMEEQLLLDMSEAKEKNSSPSPSSTKYCGEDNNSSRERDFLNCLLLLQERLSVTLDLTNLCKLAPACILITFKRGETIQVHLSDLIRICAHQQSSGGGGGPCTRGPLSATSSDGSTDSPIDSGSPLPHPHPHSLPLPLPGRTHSKQSLRRNVHGLFFLYKGYITSESKKSFNGSLDGEEEEDEEDEIGLGVGGGGGVGGGKGGGPKEALSLAAEYRKIELTHARSGGLGSRGSHPFRGASQHGPGWVFGRLREGLKEGIVTIPHSQGCLPSFPFPPSPPPSQRRPPPPRQILLGMAREE
jgi:hypothetical protein